MTFSEKKIAIYPYDKDKSLRVVGLWMKYFFQIFRRFTKLNKFFFFFNLANPEWQLLSFSSNIKFFREELLLLLGILRPKSGLKKKRLS